MSEKNENLIEEILDKEDWKKSKISYFSGYSTGKKAVSSLIHSVLDSKTRLSAFWKMAMSDDDTGVAIKNTDASPREKFKEAMILNNKTIKDIKYSVFNTWRQFWVLVSMMAILILLEAYTIFTLRTNIFSISSLAQIMFMLLPSPIIIALCLRAGYTNWMFRKRELRSLKEYLNSNDMFPLKEIERGG